MSMMRRSVLAAAALLAVCGLLAALPAERVEATDSANCGGKPKPADQPNARCVVTENADGKHFNWWNQHSVVAGMSVLVKRNAETTWCFSNAHERGISDCSHNSWTRGWHFYRFAWHRNTHGTHSYTWECTAGAWTEISRRTLTGGDVEVTESDGCATRTREMGCTSSAWAETSRRTLTGGDVEVTETDGCTTRTRLLGCTSGAWAETGRRTLAGGDIEITESDGCTTRTRVESSGCTAGTWTETGRRTLAGGDVEITETDGCTTRTRVESSGCTAGTWTETGRRTLAGGDVEITETDGCTTRTRTETPPPPPPPPKPVLGSLGAIEFKCYPRTNRVEAGAGLPGKHSGARNARPDGPSPTGDLLGSATRWTSRGGTLTYADQIRIRVLDRDRDDDDATGDPAAIGGVVGRDPLLIRRQSPWPGTWELDPGRPGDDHPWSPTQATLKHVWAIPSVPADNPAVHGHTGETTTGTAATAADAAEGWTAWLTRTDYEWAKYELDRGSWIHVWTDLGKSYEYLTHGPGGLPVYGGEWVEVQQRSRALSYDPAAVPTTLGWTEWATISVAGACPDAGPQNPVAG